MRLPRKRRPEKTTPSMKFPPMPSSKPHPDTGYVMTPDEQRIYDWLHDATHRDTKRGILPAGSLVEFRNAIAAGRHHMRGICAHCGKVIPHGQASSWGTAKWRVHEKCRTELFEGRATFVIPGSKDDRIDHAAAKQNVDGANG